MRKLRSERLKDFIGCFLGEVGLEHRSLIPKGHGCYIRPRVMLGYNCPLS